MVTTCPAAAARVMFAGSVASGVSVTNVTGGFPPAPRTKQRDRNGAIVGGRRLPGMWIRTRQRDVNGAIVGGTPVWLSPLF